MSPEYTRSWHMAAIDAAGAYEKGATGAGITVAVIDTGIDFAQPDLAGRISSQSTDVFPGRNDPDRGSRHGTRVSGMIAANFDGTGTVGVAYLSTILSIRADDTPTGACPTEGCEFEDRELVTALDYAVSHGARIVNMSLGGPTPDGVAFEAALKRAVDAGVVVTFSAGNDSTPNPEWPARYAVDGRYVGSVMAVGASNQAGDMADFSGRAGVAANGFIVAPGEGVVTDCDAGSCWRVSGTSFSSPIVAGALALLLQSFPMITGRDAVDILFRTATDKGAPGVDPIWGHGLLNLRAAFLPVGALTIPTATGVIIDPVGAPGGTLGSAFGDAVRDARALNTFGRDDYRRIFEVNLGQVFPSGQGGLIAAAAPATRATAVTLAGPGGSRLSMQAEQPVFADSALPERMLDFTGMRQPSSALVSAQVGRLSFSAWRGEGGATAPNAGDRDVFRAVAAPDQIMQAGWSIGGGWSLAAEQGSSDRLDILAFREVEATKYVATTAAYARNGFSAAFTAGAMDEPLGPLGSNLSQRTVFNLPAQTRFGAVAFSARAGDRLTLRGDAALGRTRIEDGFFDTDGEATSSQWRLGAYGDCSLIGVACDSFALELEQPLRIEGGTFTTVLADLPADWRDPTTFSTRRFSASPSGRELDLRLTMARDFGGWGLFRLRTVAGFNQGHRDDQGLSLGAALDWRVTF